MRDSTQWRSFSIPGAASGHELFFSLDIVGNNLYVVYNAGLQVWDIGGASAEEPQRSDFADGWAGHFLDFPPPGEQDFFIFDVDAIDPSGGATGNLVAVAGEDGVGTSFWEHTATGLEQLYQDAGNGSRQIRLVEFGGTVFAFAAAGGVDGVLVYNVSAAANLTTPCLDDGGLVCPGVFLGELGTTSNVSYLDVMLANGRVYIAAGRSVLLPAEIWEISNPLAPATAIRKFTGLNGGVEGVALFQKGSNFYLGAVQRLPGPPPVWEARIYEISNCIFSSSCNLGSPRWTYRPAQVGQNRFLTYSVSNGTPYIYYGVQSNNLSGTAIEGLFNLIDLTPSGPLPAIPEVTATGGTYTDQCTGNTVDYWGDYYSGNGHGLRNTRPRVGKFEGEHFYRAAFGILDVHKLTDPSPTLTLSGPAEVCPGEANTYLATPNSCSPQPPTAPYSWSATGDSTVTGNTSTAQITWNSDSPPTATVSVTNPNCPGAQDTLQVSIQDPDDLGFESGVSVNPSTPGLGEIATFHVDTSPGTASWQWTFTWEVNGVPQTLERPPVFDRTAGETATFQIPANADVGISVGSATVTISNCTGDMEQSDFVNFDVVLNPLEVNEFQARGCVLGFCDFEVNEPVVFDQDFSGNPAQARYDWDGDGTFDQVINNPGPTVTHVYPAAMNNFFPQVEITNPGVSPVIFTHLDPINISPAAPPPPPPQNPTIVVQGPAARNVNQSGLYNAGATGCTPSPTGWTWTATGGGMITGNATSSQVTISWSSAGTKTVRATNVNCGAAQGTRTVIVTGSGEVLDASFTFSPANPMAGESVTFNASSSTGNIAFYSWNFGDGSTGGGQVVTHVFETPGTYPVSLTVEEPNCSSPQCLDVLSLQVVVGGEGPPPPPPPPPTPISNEEKLILPYFIVDTFAPPGEGLTTLFSVRNNSDSELTVMFEYFASDSAEPFTTEELTLSPHGVRSVDLRVVPSLPNDPDTGIATGYAHITAVEVASEDRVIGGGYFVVDRVNDFSSGSPLLTMAAPDLCSVWQIQFFNGGDFDGTGLTFYVPENPGGGGRIATGTVYDQLGNQLSQIEFAESEISFSAETGDMDLGVDFGAIELVFEEGIEGHVGVLYRASGRFSVGSPAICMD